MTAPFVTEVLVADHGAELRQRAGTARLAALARCCRPTAWGRAMRRIPQAINRLRAGMRAPRPAACCAGT